MRSHGLDDDCEDDEDHEEDRGRLVLADCAAAMRGGRPPHRPSLFERYSFALVRARGCRLPRDCVLALTLGVFPTDACPGRRVDPSRCVLKVIREGQVKRGRGR
jgi:hypothetical protein